jgi:hypothetical protein
VRRLGVQVGGHQAVALQLLDAVPDPAHVALPGGLAQRAHLRVEGGRLLEQRHERGVLQVHRDEPAVGPVDAVHRHLGRGAVRRAGLAAGAHGGVQVVHRLGHERPEDGGLGAEVGVEAAVRDPGRRRDVGDPGLEEAVALEHLAGGDQQPGPHPAAALGGRDRGGLGRPARRFRWGHRGTSWPRR